MLLRIMVAKFLLPACLIVALAAEADPQLPITTDDLKQEVDRGAASAKMMESGAETLQADAESMGVVQREVDAENNKLVRSLDEAVVLAQKCQDKLSARKHELAENKEKRDAAVVKDDKAQKLHDKLENELASVNKDIELLLGQVTGLKQDISIAKERYQALTEEESELQRELDEAKKESDRRLAQLEKELNEARDALKKAKAESSAMQESYNEAAHTVDDLKAQVDKLHRRLEDARKAADVLKTYASEASMLTSG